MRRQLILIAIILTMAGCRDDGPTPREQLAGERLQREKGQRMLAESNRDKEAASKEQWQGFTAIAVFGAIILFITGTILGSRARHDAKGHK